MTTNNAIARHIAIGKVAKYMGRESAIHIWNDLRNEGWIKDGCKLVRPEECEGAFCFGKKGDRIVVSYLEVVKA